MKEILNNFDFKLCSEISGLSIEELKKRAKEVLILLNSNKNGTFHIEPFLVRHDERAEGFLIYKNE